MNISSTPKKNRIQLAQDHDYDIELWAWGPDYADPTAILAMFESDHPSNYSLWSSDEFDKLYNEANTTLAGDETARWDNLIKCNDICTENAGCIPLFQTGSATLTKSNVTGITEHNTCLLYTSLVEVVKKDAWGNPLPVHVAIKGLEDNLMYVCSLNGIKRSGKTWNHAGITLPKFLSAGESMKFTFMKVDKTIVEQLS